MAYSNNFAVVANDCIDAHPGLDEFRPRLPPRWCVRRRFAALSKKSISDWLPRSTLPHCSSKSTTWGGIARCCSRRAAFNVYLESLTISLPTCWKNRDVASARAPCQQIKDHRHRLPLRVAGLLHVEDLSTLFPGFDVVEAPGQSLSCFARRTKRMPQPPADDAAEFFGGLSSEATNESGVAAQRFRVQLFRVFGCFPTCLERHVGAHRQNGGGAGAQSFTAMTGCHCGAYADRLRKGRGVFWALVSGTADVAVAFRRSRERRNSDLFSSRRRWVILRCFKASIAPLKKPTVLRGESFSILNTFRVFHDTSHN